MIPFEEVLRMLSGQYKASTLVHIAASLIRDAMTPGGLPEHMQKQQIEIVLAAFASYSLKYHKRIVP